MKSKAFIEEELRLYKEKFPLEEDRIKDVGLFLHQHEDKELFTRKNFNGHLTGSAFVINAAGDSVLMIKHNFLSRWLQPGGHIDEADESILDAALREVEEETGLSRTSLKVFYPHIFDVDSHAIPENVKKNEPAHVHHDIRYLFQYNNEGSLNLDANEVTAFDWLLFSELSKLPGFAIVAEKLFKTTGFK